MSNRYLAPLAVLAALTASAPVFAMGSSDPAPKQTEAPANPDYTMGRAAIEKKDWPGAIAALQKVVAKEPGNADAWNYLGYAQRNGGDVAAALVSYDKALSANPKHRGAHEYMGEAYLMQKNLAKAEELLAKLDKLCTFGCAEYTELKNKVAAFKKAQSS